MLRLIAVAGAFGLAVVFSACAGTSSSTGNAQAARCADRAQRVNVADGGGGVATSKATKVFLSWTDVSGSTEKSRPNYLPDELLFVRRAAHEHGQYYADAFGGDPRATTDFPVQGDFTGDKPGFAGNTTLADADRDCDAKSLADPLKALDRKSPKTPGTSILKTLAVTANFVTQLPDATPYVALFTDGQLIESDWDVRTQPLTDARLQRLLKRWVPRLRGLRSAHIYLVGVAHGGAMTERQLDDVRHLLNALLGRVGATLDVFDARFANNFVASGA
jgi:hypothetical protein